jgi:hypothetical protein
MYPDKRGAMRMVMTMLAIYLMVLFNATGTDALSSALFRRTANISATNFSVHTVKKEKKFFSSYIRKFRRDQVQSHI